MLLVRRKLPPISWASQDNRDTLNRNREKSSGQAAGSIFEQCEPCTEPQLNLRSNLSLLRGNFLKFQPLVGGGGNDLLENAQGHLGEGGVDRVRRSTRPLGPLMVVSGSQIHSL
jgi:hypothetical protein